MRKSASKFQFSLALAAALLFVFSGVANAAPAITSWSSSGGTTQNKNDAQDIMYLVQQGDSITFSITASGATSYKWYVNKVDQNNNNANFVFSVPACDKVKYAPGCIWEVSAEASDGTSAYVEWVISTLSSAEAPEFFDSFTDAQMTGTRTTDPWGRALPAWSGASAGGADTKFYRSYSRTDVAANIPNMPYGTYQYKFRFYNYTHARSDGSYFTLFGTDGKAFFQHLTRDDHDYFDVYNNNLPDSQYRIDRNSLAQAPAYDYMEDNAWHTATLIHTREHYWYLYFDDEIEPEKADNVDSVHGALNVQFMIENTDLDGIEFFKDKYFIPGAGRIENSTYVYNWYYIDTSSKYIYWSYPLYRTGINVYGADNTLSDIYTKIGNPSLISYDGIIGGKPTYTVYTDLVIRKGASLKMSNERLRIHSNTPGERIFRVKVGAQLYIDNSIIESANDNHFTWAFTSQPIGDVGMEDIAASKITPYDSNEGVYNNRRMTRYIQDGRIIITNTVIDNSGNFFLESPLEIIIKNTNFTNLVEVNFGNYSYGRREAVRQWPKDWTNFPKAFGIWPAMGLVNYTLENVRFSAKSSPVNIFFMGGYDTVVDHYLRNIVLENARIEAKTGYKYAPHEPVDGYDNYEINSNVLVVNPNTPSFATPNHAKESVMPAYYLDVLVENGNNQPVSGASVIVENEIEPFKEPPQNIRSMKRPTYTGDAVGYLHPSLGLSEGGMYDKQIDVRRMQNPKYLIDLLKIGKDDDSAGMLYEFTHASPVDLLTNGIRSPAYDAQGRLTSFEYFIYNNVKVDPTIWYSVSNIQYDANNLITSYHKYGYANKESPDRTTTIANYDYQIAYNYQNGIVNSYTVTRTWSGSPAWTVSKTINVAIITGSDGHTPLPSNPENTLVVADYKQNLTGTTQYTYNVTVKYGTKTATINGINPDTTWYRADQNVPAVTVKCNIDTDSCTLAGADVGSIAGYVRDTDNIAISGATVSSGGSAQTNSAGYYLLTNVLTGTKQVTASKTGYVSQTKSVNVLKDQTVTVDFNLAAVMPDTTPPVISSVNSSGITDSGATITWTTDDPATSQVDYGPTPSYGYSTTPDSSLATSHTVTLTGLSNNTLYYYRVRSKNADNYEGSSGSHTLTTLQTTINVGLAGWWRFDEGVLSAASDSSGNNNHGTLYGALWTAGKIGKALQFNGVDSYVQVPDSNALEWMPQLTVEAWVYYQGGESGARIVDKWKTGGGLYQLYKFGTTDNIGGFIGGTTTLMSDTDTGVAYTSNAWQHIAMVYNGSATTWYKNGNPIYTRPGLTGSIGTSTDPLYIGGRSSTSGNLNGMIDEVKIYNRSLSAQEIISEYNAANRAYVNVMQYFYPDSTITYAGAIDGKQTAGLTAIPASGNVSVFANVFTNSLVNFSADSSPNNLVAFNVTNLKPNTNYRIMKDGALFQDVQADSFGKIIFNNSVW